MNQTAKQAGPGQFAERLGGVQVGIRADLEVSRHVFRGEPSYIVRDPISFQSHCVSLGDYQVMIAVRDDRPLSRVFTDLVAADKLGAEDEERFYRFVVNLHRLGFVNLPIRNDKALYRRHQLRKKAARKQLLMSPIFMRIPLFEPDALLDRTVHLVRPIFTRWFFALWLVLMAAAVGIAVSQGQRLLQPLNGILASTNLPVMWVILVGLKLCHEFGHAYACKVFGGKVPEMGAFLIAGTPCAYVDTTAAWGFPRKAHRLIVCLAGMYVELTIAAIALIVWSFARDPLVSSVSYNIALLAGVVTVAFNINPLMRYDGYYVLSDLVEIPNLRQRARNYVVGIAKCLLLGVQRRQERLSLRMRLGLLVYGVMSMLYRVGIVLGIAAMVASKVFLLGMMLAGVYVVSECSRMLRGLLRYVLKSPETAGVRVRAAVVTALIAMAAVGAFLLPVPARVSASGVVAAERESVIRAGTPGFLTEVGVTPGQTVAAGSTLVRLANADARFALVSAQADHDAARIRLDAGWASGAAELRKQQELTKLSQERLDARKLDSDRLTVVAAAGGTVVQALRDTDVGRFVARGEPVATVISGRWVVRALVAEQDMVAARPEVGQSVWFRPHSHPAATLRGRIVRIDAAGSRRIDALALTHLAGGEVAVDPRTQMATSAFFKIAVALEVQDSVELRHGMTGGIQFGRNSESLATRTYRKFLRFTNRIRQE